MDQKIKDLYNAHRIIFFILLPLIALFLFHSLIMDLLISSAHKMFDKAQEQDKTLAAEVTQETTQANTLKTQADDIQQKIDDRKPGDISEDWNKNAK